MARKRAAAGASDEPSFVQQLAQTLLASSPNVDPQVTDPCCSTCCCQCTWPAADEQHGRAGPCCGPGVQRRRRQPARWAAEEGAAGEPCRKFCCCNMWHAAGATGMSWHDMTWLAHAGSCEPLRSGPTGRFGSDTISRGRQQARQEASNGSRSGARRSASRAQV